MIVILLIMHKIVHVIYVILSFRIVCIVIKNWHVQNAIQLIF